MDGGCRMERRLLIVWPNSSAMTFGIPRAVPELTGESGMIPVALPTIAALTPPGWKVTLVDETRSPVDFDGKYDLVGIGGTLSELPRAREVALEFRKRGIPVVCGGPSVSISPERWRPFSDVLVIGEAERTWPEFIRDFEAGRHKAEYRETEPVDLETSPKPDYSGFDPRVVRNSLLGAVQVGRGCPFGCEFCSVIVYAGRKARYKSARQVVDEVACLAGLGIKVVMLGADNFSADRRKAKEILRALRDWNRPRRTPSLFVTSVSIDVAKDTEFLELAVEAGLNRLQIGIESMNKENLRDAGKLHNLASDVADDLKTIHEHGISVIASSIVGFDHDDVSVFREQSEFYNATGILSILVFPLHAQDGTPLKDRMIREGRHIEEPDNLSSARSYHFTYFTMMPKKISLEQMRAGLLWLIRELYSPENVVKRVEKFFEEYRASPHRQRLRIPRAVPDAKTRRTAGRILRYVILRATAEERRAFRRLFRAAVRSRHPQGLFLSISTFVMMMNTLALLRMEEPDLGRIVEPTPAA